MYRLDHDYLTLSESEAATHIIAENSFHFWSMDSKKGQECMKIATDNFIHAGVAGKIREAILVAAEVCTYWVADRIDS